MMTVAVATAGCSFDNTARKLSLIFKTTLPLSQKHLIMRKAMIVGGILLVFVALLNTGRFPHSIPLFSLSKVVEYPVTTPGNLSPSLPSDHPSIGSLSPQPPILPSNEGM